MTVAINQGDTPQWQQTSAVAMPSGNGPDEEMDRRALACSEPALDDVGSAHASHCALRPGYFRWATTTTMAQQLKFVADVRTGLRVSCRSGDGPQSWGDRPASNGVLRKQTGMLKHKAALLFS